MSIVRKAQTGGPANKLGIHNGGEFGHKQTSEAGGLIAPARDWGQLNLSQGSRTPWGPAQNVIDYSDGIAVVSCAGHGGLKLSPERNKAIPVALRQSSGWYEEDCDFQIAGMYFPEETRPTTGRGYSENYDLEKWEEYCRQGVRDYHWGGYEKATGEEIRPGESSGKDEAMFLARHEDRWMTSGGFSNTDDPNIVKVGAKRGTETREVLVNRALVRDQLGPRELGHKPWAYKLDESIMVDAPAPPPEPEKPPVPLFHGIKPLSEMTSTAANLVNRDLNRRWRKANGNVQTLQKTIETDGLTGKTVMMENGARKFYLKLQGGYVNPVSKATFNAVDAPDDRTELDRAREDADYAWHKEQNSTHYRFSDEHKKLVSNLEAANRKVEAASATDKARRAELASAE